MSTLDADGCLWICLSPGCPEPAAGELEAEDLAGAGVSTSRGTGSDVEDEALAGRLARLVGHIVDAEAARARDADATTRRDEELLTKIARGGQEEAPPVREDPDGGEDCPQCTAQLPLRKSDAAPPG